MPLFCSYHILTSSVIYYWTDARQHGIYLLNRWRFSRYSVPIHWLVHCHITSNNETVSRQMPWAQPLSQGLSSLPPWWSLEERPWLRLVTWPLRIWVVKKICWMRGVAECFVCCCDKLCGFQNLERSLKIKLPALSRFEVEWMLHDFCCLQKIEDFRSSVHKEIRQPNLTVSKCKTSRIESNGSVSWIFEFGGNFYAVFWLLKVFLLYGGLVQYSDLHFIYSSANQMITVYM